MPEVYHVVQLPLFAPTRMCVKCQTEKTVTDFGKNTKSPSGYQTYCKDCMYFTYSKTKDPTRRRSYIQKPLTSRTCSQCHIEKPISEFYKASSEKTGHKSMCKECHGKKYDEHKRPGIRRERRAKIVSPGYKWCVGCRREQPIERFTTDRDKKDGRSTLCYSCRNAYHRTYEQSRCGEQREQRNAYARAWQRAHPLQRQEICVRRRARKRQATVSRVSYKRILERDGYWCYICERSIDPSIKSGPSSLTFDHVKPLAGKGNRKGTHSEDNIKPAHRACNLRKHTYLLEEMTPFQRRGPDM